MRALADLSLSRQFLITSLPVLLCCMVAIGTLVSREVEHGVVNRIGGVTGLYVESFVAPHVQTLLQADDLSPADRDSLGKLLRNTPLGEKIVAFKVWRPDGRVLYSRNPEMIGRTFPVEEGLEAALDGSIQSKISTLSSHENQFEAGRWHQLLETYVPIHGDGTGKVVAVAEFYQATDEIEREAWIARRNSWAVVASTVLTMYLLLFGLVHRGSRLIGRQREELRSKVAQLSDLIGQNQQLHDRVQRAAVRSTAVNEQLLRRISSDLHDGPGQDMGLALMQCEALADHCDGCLAGEGRHAGTVASIRSSLQSALADLRGICGGLRLPDIEPLPIDEVARRAVRDYERKSGARVEQRIEAVQAPDSIPLKIALYRLLQEGLANGFRHGGGCGQQVSVGCVANQLLVQVSDSGAGFDPVVAAQRGGHGLIGMRERAEILGGSFDVVSSPQGTVVCVTLPLGLPEMQHA